MKTTLFKVPARSSYLGEGSLAVVRVLQASPVVSRISVESSSVNDPLGQYAPPVTSRTWIVRIMKCLYFEYKTQLFLRYH